MRAFKIILFAFSLLFAVLWVVALLIGVWLPDVFFAPKSTIAYSKLPSGYTFRVIQYWNRVDFYSTELHILYPFGREQTHTLDGDDAKSWRVPMKIDESNRVVSVTLSGGREKQVSY